MSNGASLVFYIVAFLLSTMFVYFGNREKAYKLRLVLGSRHITINPSLVIGVLIPILVAGFRWDVGTDFNNYIIEYNAAIQGGSYLEASFNIIANMSYALFGTPTFMLVVFAAMTVIPVMLGINKSTLIQKRYRWLFWLLFLFVMFPQTFNMLRQGVAVAVGFYLIISIVESRKFFRLSRLIGLLLAISFHASAWLLVPIGYVAHVMNNKRKQPLVLFVAASSVVAIACFSVLPLLLGWLGGAWSSYLEGTLVSRSVVPRSILILVIVLVCWKFYDVLKIANSYTSLLWIGLLLSLGGLYIAYFERAGYYVTLLLPLLVMTMIAQKVSRPQASLINSIVCIFSFAYFVGVYYLMGSSDVFPYNWSI